MTMRAPTRIAIAAALVAALAACGGKPPAPTPVANATEPPAARAAGDEMVPPEQMDEINRDLERKRPAMARCFAMVVDSHELPRGAAGKLTLEIVIGGGRAETVKVVRTNLDSKSLAECVIAKVKEIQFPQLAAPYETSFTYGFEAM
jgi:type IV pilus biogenesis protein CpaD/CtpE